MVPTDFYHVPAPTLAFEVAPETFQEIRASMGSEIDTILRISGGILIDQGNPDHPNIFEASRGLLGQAAEAIGQTAVSMQIRTMPVKPKSACINGWWHYDGYFASPDDVGLMISDNLPAEFASGNIPLNQDYNLYHETGEQKFHSCDTIRALEQGQLRLVKTPTNRAVAFTARHLHKSSVNPSNEYQDRTFIRIH